MRDQEQTEQELREAREKMAEMEKMMLEMREELNSLRNARRAESARQAAEAAAKATALAAKATSDATAPMAEVTHLAPQTHRDETEQIQTPTEQQQEVTNLTEQRQQGQPPGFYHQNHPNLASNPPPADGYYPYSGPWQQYYPPDARYCRGGLPFSMTVDQLPKFSAEDTTQTISSWIEKVTDDALLNSWTPAETLLAAKRALTGTVRRWLDAQVRLDSWENMKAGLEKAFGRRILASDIHSQMQKRRKKSEESIVSYVQEMQFLGFQGKLLQEDIRKYIVNGVTEDVQMRVTLRAATSDEYFIEMLETHDSEMKSKRNKENKKSQFTRKNGSGLRCFRCRELGHKVVNCTKLEEENKETAPTSKKSEYGKSTWTGHNNKKTDATSKQANKPKEEHP